MSKLLDLAKKRFNNPSSRIARFVDDDKANKLLNDLKEHPHAYVLACLMDRQIKAEGAWMIPYEVFSGYKAFHIDELAKIGLRSLKNFFCKKKLHRFNDLMAEVFHCGIRDIADKYKGDASAIWRGKPSSAAVVYRFMEFHGSGIKISTMATNILARQFRVPFSDFYSIDISPDVHVIRVMKRMGYVPKDAKRDMVIYKARELNPEFPGIFDSVCWEIGRKWCKPKKPLCHECSVREDCDYARSSLR